MHPRSFLFLRKPKSSHILPQKNSETGMKAIQESGFTCFLLFITKYKIPDRLELFVGHVPTCRSLSSYMHHFYSTCITPKHPFIHQAWCSYTFRITIVHVNACVLMMTAMRGTGSSSRASTLLRHPRHPTIDVNCPGGLGEHA